MDGREQLQAMVTGFRVSSVLAVAADLGIADELAGGPRTAAELATVLSADPDGLQRLLRALTAVGVFEERDGAFSLGPMGSWLRSDTPGSLRPLARTLTDAALWSAWGHLGHSVRTGDNAFQALHGMDVWAHRAARPEHNAVFNANMASLSTRYADAVAAAYDFGRHAHVVDVGGGHGVLLEAVLARHPHLRGTVFDQPHVVGHQPPGGVESVAARWTAASGDFFDAVPSADCVLLKWILHDWPDQECTRILRSCRRAIGDDGVVLVVERVLGRPGFEVEAALSDLNMLVLPGGRERTEEEYDALVRTADLRLRRVIHTEGPMSILELAAMAG
ncbi:MAG: methyltransferase [Nocardioidaceae bacterium]